MNKPKKLKVYQPITWIKLMLSRKLEDYDTDKSMWFKILVIRI